MGLEEAFEELRAQVPELRLRCLEDSGCEVRIGRHR
jgi:hypothetical protein